MTIHQISQAGFYFSICCPEDPLCHSAGWDILRLRCTACQAQFQLNSKESNDKGDKPPATCHAGSHEGVNTSQTASTNSDKPEPTPISSAGLSTDHRNTSFVDR